MVTKETPIKIQIVKTLSNLQPSRVVVVKGENEDKFSLYVTDKNGIPYPIDNSPDVTDFIKDIKNTDGNLIITGFATKTINISPALLSTINSAIQPGGNVSDLTNDAGYLTEEVDPIFQASEASLFESGDKTNLDNQSGINTGDETTASIKLKRPLKTINGDSLEGVGNVQISYDDLSDKPTSFPPSNHTHIIADVTGLQTALDSKQPNLVSGTNIKTIEGQSLIGSGNIDLNKSDVGLSNVDNTSDLAKPISTATQAALNNKEDKNQKGIANGYTPLDSNNKVPLIHINDSLIGNVNFQGLWNPSTNVPNLTVVSPKGHYYICTADGNRFGIDFKTGDWIISDGTSWSKVDNTDAVSSVFGRTGNVVAQLGDYTTAQVTETTNKNYQTDNQKLFNDVTSSIQTQLNSKVNKSGIESSLPILDATSQEVGKIEAIGELASVTGNSGVLLNAPSAKVSSLSGFTDYLVGVGLDGQLIPVKKEVTGYAPTATYSTPQNITANTVTKLGALITTTQSLTSPTLQWSVNISNTSNQTNTVRLKLGLNSVPTGSYVNYTVPRLTSLVITGASPYAPTINSGTEVSVYLEATHACTVNSVTIKLDSGVSSLQLKTVGGQSLLGTGNVTEVQNSLAASSILAPSVDAVNTALAGKANASGSNATGVWLNSSIAINNVVYTDANQQTLTGLRVFNNTTGSTNFPNVVGTGIEVKRASPASLSSVGSFQLWSSNSADNEFYFRRVTNFSTAEVWSPWRKIWTDDNLINPVTGTGTTNTLPKFTGAGTIGSSRIFDRGTGGISFGGDLLFGGYEFITTAFGTNSLFLGTADGVQNPRAYIKHLTVSNQTQKVVLGSAFSSGQPTASWYLENGNFVLGSLTDNLTDKLQVNGSAIANAWKVAGGLVTDYQTGTGTVVDFGTTVRGTVLTGYTAGTNTALAATDTLLAAMGKIQGQITARENAITAGTTLQYYRGDKTWQTLNSAAVPELTNLYFTNARAIAAPITGYVSGAGTVAATDTVLQAINKLNGNDGLKANIAGQVFTGNITAPSIIRTGGTANQMLMADGSTRDYSTLPTYADNAAAITGGLAVGALYRTIIGLLAVRF